MLFEITEEELNELVGGMFGAVVTFESDKITVSAAAGTIRFSLYLPRTPLDLSKDIEIPISMSLTVKMFLGKLKADLKKKGMQDAVKISSDKIVLNVGKFKEGTWVNLLKNKVLKRWEINGKSMRVEL